MTVDESALGRARERDDEDPEVLVAAGEQALDAPVEHAGVPVHWNDRGDRRSRRREGVVVAVELPGQHEVGEPEHPGEGQTPHHCLEDDDGATAEGTQNTDGTDGPNYVDTDNDGDGISDAAKTRGQWYLGP